MVNKPYMRGDAKGGRGRPQSPLQREAKASGTMRRGVGATAKPPQQTSFSTQTELKRILKGEALKSRQSLETSSQFPVTMTKGSHLFPSRTQKLSPSVPKVLGWTRPGRIGRCRNPIRSSTRRLGSFFAKSSQWTYGVGLPRSFHGEIWPSIVWRMSCRSICHGAKHQPAKRQASTKSKKCLTIYSVRGKITFGIKITPPAPEDDTVKPCKGA